MRFVVFMVAKIEFVVFSVVALCSVVVGYQCSENCGAVVPPSSWFK
jgi:hypothetical protein